jgi:hypothetical protein
VSLLGRGFSVVESSFIQTNDGGAGDIPIGAAKTGESGRRRVFISVEDVFSIVS